MYRIVLCFCLALMLVLASTSYGIVIADFEQQMDHFKLTWESPAATLNYSTTGATLNTYSLAVTPGQADGFRWSVMHENVEDIVTNPILEFDVTWVASEWGTTSWVNAELIAVNSDLGWWQTQVNDPLNPSYPGGWDPVGWGDHTRHLTADLSGLTSDMSGITWMQICFATNFGGVDTVGNYYYDNVQLTPEPTTIALLGLGGLALLRRKRA